mmetsp:Transcript_37676/g.100247  ORF Transcript_37676/g.100247 Transcript_37676/m.100247 type:complete len:242 (+) Transcript_37676:308-1033(+)
MALVVWNVPRVSRNIAMTQSSLLSAHPRSSKCRSEVKMSCLAFTSSAAVTKPSRSSSATFNSFCNMTTVPCRPDSQGVNSSRFRTPSRSRSSTAKSSRSSAEASLSLRPQNSIMSSTWLPSLSLSRKVEATCIWRTFGFNSGKNKPVNSSESKRPSPLRSAARNFLSSSDSYLRRSASLMFSSSAARSKCARNWLMCSSRLTRESPSWSMSPSMSVPLLCMDTLPADSENFRISSRDNKPS